MIVLADTVMMLWPVVVMAMFVLLPPSRAVSIAFVVGWMFLPFKSYPLNGLPDLTKTSLTCYSVALATLLLDPLRITAFRPRWFDLSIVGVCLAPAISSLDNDLGLYDAAAASVSSAVTWGLPYLLGRLYLTDTASLRFLAMMMVYGSLAYLPLCWFEMRMSPQLHLMIYGMGDFRWGGMRLGGWRPSVFFESGLQLGLWMSAATLLAGWLWKVGEWRCFARLPAGAWLALLAATTVLCRSSGALILLVGACAVLGWTVLTRNRLALVGLVLVCPLYMAVRSTGNTGWQDLITVIERIDVERAESLEFRFINEDMLVSKALARPLFGWGGWGRSRIYDEWGKDICVTDGLWMIELGTHGLFGLVSLYAVLLLPLATLVFSFPARRLAAADLAPVLGLAIAVTLFGIDCLLNAMVSPIYAFAAGGVLSTVRSMARSERRSRGPRRPAREYRESNTNGSTALELSVKPGGHSESAASASQLPLFESEAIV
jgi:hypothetical protein